MPDTVARLRREAPQVDWRCGDAGDPESYVGIATADRVIALEVLQYLPFAATLERWWSLVRPGGRLVIIVPNADCPIVAKPVARFTGRFQPVSVGAVVEAVTRLPEVATWAWRGFTFAQDQSIQPYAIGAWTREVTTPLVPPNRLQFAVCRRP